MFLSGLRSAEERHFSAARRRDGRKRIKPVFLLADLPCATDAAVDHFWPVLDSFPPRATNGGFILFPVSRFRSEKDC